MIVHALQRRRPRPRLRRRRRAARHRLERRLGDGGVDRDRGRRVRPLAAQARPRDRRAHQRRARPPLDLRARGSTSRRRSATFMARAPARAVVWDRPALRALCPPDARRLRRARRPCCTPGGSRFRLARASTVSVCGPGRPQRGQRRRRARRRARSPAPIPSGRRRRSPTSAARGAGSSCSGETRVGRRASTTTTPTIRPRSRRRSPRPATLEPARLIAVFQPHLFSRTRALGARVRRARWPAADLRRRARHLPGPRAGRGLPGRRRPPRRRGGRRRRRRAAPVAWLPGFARRRARTWRGSLRAGDLCLVMGAGNVDALGRSLVVAVAARSRCRERRLPCRNAESAPGRRARLPAGAPDHGPHRAARPSYFARAGNARASSSGWSPGRRRRGSR